MTIQVAAFYRFFPFSDYIQWRAPLRARMREAGLKGTILLAPEGINATIAGGREGLEAVLAQLRTHSGMQALEVKWSEAPAMPFGRAKVKLKKEIIGLGRPVSPLRVTGARLTPVEWNTLIQQPGTYILDTRNDYEVAHGTFRGAVNPHIRTFKELPGFIEQTLKPSEQARIATFCTGGIRCEKLTAWLKERGFEEVYQLEGGILTYLQEIPPQESLWQGECFVFDEREAVGHGNVSAAKKMLQA